MVTGHLLLAGTIVCTVAGQLLIKHGVDTLPPVDGGLPARLVAACWAMLQPSIAAGLVCALVGAACWIAALSQLQLSQAYPFMSATFLLVFLASWLVFGEPFDWYRLAGNLIIMLGIIVTVLGGRG